MPEARRIFTAVLTMRLTIGFTSRLACYNRMHNKSHEPMHCVDLTDGSPTMQRHVTMRTLNRDRDHFIELRIGLNNG